MISLLKYFMILTQIMKIDWRNLANFHIYKTSSYLRTSLYKIKILRGKHDNIHIPNILTQFSLFNMIDFAFFPFFEIISSSDKELFLFLIYLLF